MNTLLVKQALSDLQKISNDLMTEHNSRGVEQAKVKIEEAIFWLKDSVEIEEVFK